MKKAPRIERQILDYLAENPKAKDTLRGIVEWWLLKQNIARAKAQVELALARLVAQGKVGAQTAPDGQVLYGSLPGSLRAGRPIHKRVNRKVLRDEFETKGNTTTGH